MKELSRRDFLKGALAGTAAAALTTVTGVSAFAEEKGIYTPGTYSASAKGIGSDVTVTMTFDANSITDVAIDVSGETPGIGDAIGEQMQDAILAAQGADIDAVTGASVTSDAIRQAAAACIEQASGQAVTLTEREETVGDWLGEAPEIAESDITEELETEVLVVDDRRGRGRKGPHRREGGRPHQDQGRHRRHQLQAAAGSLQGIPRV